MNVAVIGSGSWGTAVAVMVAARAPTTLWARRREATEAMISSRENSSYLPGIELPESLVVTSDLVAALSSADVVVVAVPSHVFREVLERAGELVLPDARVVSLTKGIERGSQLRMTEVAADVLAVDSTRIGVLTGPNLAREIALGQPAAAVLAIGDEASAEELQALFTSRRFRVYRSPDVVGCESAGALKNAMAIAAGMAHGLGYGDNSKAALVTRALAELTRLGVALGGAPLTYAGLAGMGDLVATCFSGKSRNRRVGVELGRGKSLETIVTEMRMVAEGVKSTEAILALASSHGIEMPIAEAVGSVLYEGSHPADMVEALMSRDVAME